MGGTKTRECRPEREDEYKLQNDYMPAQKKEMTVRGTAFTFLSIL